MTDNIYQVVSEFDLDELIEMKADSLLVTMFTDHVSLDRNVVSKMKLRYYTIAQRNSDVYFLYIDLRNYSESPLQKYTKGIKIPKFVFFHKREEAGYVEGPDMNIFEKTLNDVAEQLRNMQIETTTKINSNLLGGTKTSIENLRNGNVEQSQQPLQTTHEQHLDSNVTKEQLEDLVRMQKMLQNNGQNIDLQQLIKLQSVQNSQNTRNKQHHQETEQQPVNVDPQRETNVKKLQELQNMKYMMQLKQFNQLQQLKKIKELKEMQEKRKNSEE